MLLSLYLRVYYIYSVYIYVFGFQLGDVVNMSKLVYFEQSICHLSFIMCHLPDSHCDSIISDPYPDILSFVIPSHHYLLMYVCMYVLCICSRCFIYMCQFITIYDTLFSSSFFSTYNSLPISLFLSIQNSEFN